MKPRVWSMLSVFLFACPSTPPPVRVASPEVKSADGKHTAHVEVQFIAGFVGPHSSRSDEVKHVLVIDGRSVPFDQFPRIAAPNVRAASKATFTLRFAADGRTVAINDGSSWWNHVLLDLDPPFRCSGAGTSTTTTARELVRESLTSLVVEPEKRVCDVDGLTRYLCSAKDEALWLEAIPPVLESSLVDVERYPLLDCLRPALDGGAVRDQLIAGLANPRRVEVAAEALRGRAEVTAERALVAALRVTDREPESIARCSKAAKLSWALASGVVAKKSAEEETRALLRNDVASAPACPNELTGKARRVYSLAALSALGDSSATSLAASCSVETAASRVAFVQWNEAMVDGLVNQPLPCLARAFTR